MTSSARRSVALSISVGLFVVGLIAILVIFGLAAAGFGDLPVWLNVTAMLAPLGLGVGLVSMLVRAVRARSLTRN